MQILDCEQGSPEWYEARLGVVTASRFKDVMTNPRSKADKEAGKLSESADTYMCELIAETLTGKMKEISAASLEWGHVEEPKARSDYDFSATETLTPVGFILRDDGLVGASPDSLVGDNGGLEIKSPANPAIHIKTLVREKMPDEHMPQVQGCMWIAEREWWDFMSFRNDMPPGAQSMVVRIYRDESYINELEIKVARFLNLMGERLELIRSKTA
jgi:hypothetical protein